MIDSEKIQFTTEICMYIYLMGFFLFDRINKVNGAKTHFKGQGASKRDAYIN